MQSRRALQGMVSPVVHFDGRRLASEPEHFSSTHAGRAQENPQPPDTSPRETCLGDSEFRAFKLDVLRIEGGAIAEITTFGYGLRAFGLPPTL